MFNQYAHFSLCLTDDPATGGATSMTFFDNTLGSRTPLPNLTKGNLKHFYGGLGTFFFIYIKCFKWRLNHTDDDKKKLWNIHNIWAELADNVISIECLKQVWSAKPLLNIIIFLVFCFVFFACLSSFFVLWSGMYMFLTCCPLFIMLSIKLAKEQDRENTRFDAQ
jgi:hypothetical protein